MSKRIVSVAIVAVVMLISWFVVADDTTETASLYVVPEEGEFVVDVPLRGN